MRPLQRRIQLAAQKESVSQLVVERDYAQGYVLLGIASLADLKQGLVFKGGTALRKIHFGTYRFSEDLDFSGVAVPRGADLDRAVCAAIEAARAAAQQISPLLMTVERYEERDAHPGGQEAFTVRVQFPWQRRPLVPVRIEVTQDEPVLLEASARPIVHGYEESLDASLRTYCLEEICAEKLRSTRQTWARLAQRGWARSRARDYYDLWRLVRLDPGRIDWTVVSDILPRKCAVRGVSVASVDDVFDPTLTGEVRATWERTLGPFVSELPAVEMVLSETRERLEALLRL